MGIVITYLFSGTFLATMLLLLVLWVLVLLIFALISASVASITGIITIWSFLKDDRNRNTAYNDKV